MTNGKKLMWGLDASKYPSRTGQPWDDSEAMKLLASIQKKKSIEEIAKEHERTVGGIKSYIRKLAADYHINDGRTMEEIQRFTGLTKAEIEDAVKRRMNKEALQNCTTSTKIKIVKKINKSEEELPSMMEVVSLLKDIQNKLNMLIEKVS